MAISRKLACFREDSTNFELSVCGHFTDSHETRLSSMDGGARIHWPSKTPGTPTTITLISSHQHLSFMACSILTELFFLVEQVSWRCSILSKGQKILNESRPVILLLCQDLLWGSSWFHCGPYYGLPIHVFPWPNLSQIHYLLQLLSRISKTFKNPWIFKNS